MATKNASSTKSKKVVNDTTKRKKVKEEKVTSDTSARKLKEGLHFCNRCGKLMSINNFYTSDSILDKGTGYKCICKECCNKIFDDVYRDFKRLDDFEKVNSDTISWTMQTEKAFDKTCRLLDIKFDYGAYEQTRNHLESFKQRGSVVNSIFGIYKSKLSSISKTNGLKEFTYDASDTVEEMMTDKDSFRKDDEFAKLELSWGKGFSKFEYEYLEQELEDWKKTAKCEKKADLILLKEICLKELEIRKAREADKDVGKLQTTLQELMKTASLDPAKTKNTITNKAIEAYGTWQKDIETMTPAEWHKKQDKYKDMDGLLQYLNNFVKRPIMNFVTGSRNFELENENFSAIEDDKKDGE